MGDVESSTGPLDQQSSASASASDSSLSDHLVRKRTVIHRKPPSAEQQELATALKELKDSLRGLHKEDEGGSTQDGEKSGQSQPRKVIPFRSASFSAVEVAKSPEIVLKQSAFCLTSSHTLPRVSNSMHNKNKVMFQVGDPNYVDPAILAPNMQPSPQVHPSEMEVKNCSSQSAPVTPPNHTIPEEDPTQEPQFSEDVRKGTHSDSVSGQNIATPTLQSSSSEDSSTENKIEKAKAAFQSGLHGASRLPHPDDNHKGDHKEDEGSLVRQSSSQSETSDRGSSCASPPISPPAAHPFSLDTKPRSMYRSSGSVSSPPPVSSSGYGYRYTYRNPTSPPVELPSRTNSMGSGTPPYNFRYYKRPLRGPYGEMLEAEMNKVWTSRKSLNRELENLDCRESKSSSPTPQPQKPSAEGLHQGSPKFSSFTSYDDITIARHPHQHQHQANRSRKISANIPVSSSHSHSDHGMTAGAMEGPFHQRTASSPSQLSSEPKGSGRGRPLDSSPRGHVLAELLETERSYVESLRVLVKKYMEPLKSSDFVESGLVDEIFFQVPTILWHHERILEALQRRLVDDSQSVGDLLLDTFRQTSLHECYSLFVNNWKNAKGSLKMAVASKPQLARFLDANAREHKGKLSIDSLLIMPIQRIPRYELLVKELLKHTQPTHEDHSRLLLVLEKIRRFAITIGSVDPNEAREVEIDGLDASGLGHLISTVIVTVSTPSSRKERALFLFADCIILCSVKRKTVMRKTSSNQFAPTFAFASAPILEGCKFKLLLRLGLTEVVITSGDAESESSSHKSSPDELDDLKTVHKMMELAASLKSPSQKLDDALRELAASLKHQCDNNADALHLEIKPADSSETPEVIKILFGSSEKKSIWLASFQDALGKYIKYGFGRAAQIAFLCALPIRKARSGLSLSCAAPVWLWSGSGHRVDIWIANSDTYVGQVCILTLHPEPTITSCNGVCNSPINCVLSVPPVVFGASSSLHGEGEDDGHKIRKDKERWTVWLGTEDGSLLVYDCTDSVRVKKSKHKVQLKASLSCMVHYENKVYVALGNGDVGVFSRNPQGKEWLVNEPSWISIGSETNPVIKMIQVASNLWCIHGSDVKVYSCDRNATLGLVHTIKEKVLAVASDDTSIWMAHSSKIIKCYSNSTFEVLCKLDIGPEVAKTLTGCDDIIRRHKQACLRVTALLVAPDGALWIGTSAGVILTYAVNGPSSKKLIPLTHGYTGKVRFLVTCTSRDSPFVVSGGEGVEHWRPNAGVPSTPTSGSLISTSVTTQEPIGTEEGFGSEDSTNHILIWRVPKPQQIPQS